MPDLKSELSKVIQQWEAPVVTAAPAHAFKPTTNTSRATFEYIRDNPGKGRSAAINALTLKGFKASSTTTLISQMIKQGLLSDVNGGLFPNQPEYTPIKPSVLKKVRAKTALHKPVKKATPKFATPPAPTPAPVAPMTDAEVFVGQMSVRQAKDVYDYLKTIFG